MALTTPGDCPASTPANGDQAKDPDTGPKDAWEVRLHLTECCSGDIFLMALRKTRELASQGKGIFWECP